MYTTTERPNHLAQEVIDNSADEAIAGYCDEITVTLHDDGSLSVTDNGRGMPVDKHAKEGVSGVEVILTRLHAGAKFSDKNYRFSGGLHGVGVSVVNALSKKLQVWVRRDGNEYFMWFADGKKKAELKVIGQVGKRNTGTTIRFWPDEKFFDTTEVQRPAPQARHARQGRPLARAAHALHQRERQGRQRRVVLRRRPQRVPHVRARRRADGSRSAVRRPLQGIESRSRLGRGLADRRTATSSPRATSTSFRRRRAARTSTGSAPASPRRSASSASSAICCRAA